MPEWGIRYGQQTSESRHSRQLTNDRGRVSHFCCLLCGENANNRLFKVKEKRPPSPYVHHPSIHSSVHLLPLHLCCSWFHETGVKVLMEDLVALYASGKHYPTTTTTPCSLINQAGFTASVRVLWCPSHVSFQSPSEGSHGSTFTHWTQGRSVCGSECETQKGERQTEKKSERGGTSLVSERSWGGN